MKEEKQDCEFTISKEPSETLLTHLSIEHKIIIHSPTGKELHLDFNTDVLKVTGDLRMDEAAKLFIDSVKQLWGQGVNGDKE